jgi:hypothetical protein
VTELKPFPSIEKTLFALFHDKLAVDNQQMGTAYPAGDDSYTFVRVDKLGGPRSKLRDYPLVDVEAVAPTWAAASELIESIDTLILSYPHSIATPSGVVVLDSVVVTRSPVEIPWDGPGRRLAATYSLVLRRRD